MSTPLKLQVPQTRKEVYFDLALLYQDTANAVLARAEQGTLDLLLSLEGEKLEVGKQGQSRKKIETLLAWLFGFHTFMAIYLAKHPSCCAELLKYAEVIHLISIQFPGLAWGTCDKQCHLKQELDVARSCGNLNYKLWLTVAAMSLIVPLSASSPHRALLCNKMPSLVK